MNINQSKSRSAAVEAGRKEAIADQNYRYNLQINKRLMHEYLHLAKLHDKNGAKELRAFIERKVAQWKG